jgi:acyl carrier protein
MDKKHIQNSIVQILNERFGIANTQDQDYDNLLKIILSESSQALNFVVTIEDEFDIEFEDDDIDIHFFSSIDNIVNLTSLRLNMA